MAITYNAVPSAAQFKKDSSTTFGVRSQDQMLHAMDRLLEGLPTGGDNRVAMLGDLFFTTNSWIKAFHEKSKSIDPGRYQAVLALFEAVAKSLMPALGVSSLPKLSDAIVEVFGLANLGARNDSHFNATFFDKKTRESKRIIFKAGRLYRYMLDVPGAPAGLQPLNTYHFDSPEIVRPGAGMPLRFFAPFVMSMEREFYVSKHFVGKGAGQGGIFHSAYFNGPVAMAGTMLVEHGLLKGIRGDSGHYKPGEPNMINALRALRARGVNLRSLVVYDFADPTQTANGRALGKNASMLNNARLPAPPIPPQSPNIYNQPRVINEYNVARVVQDTNAADAVEEFYAN